MTRTQKTALAQVVVTDIVDAVLGEIDRGQLPKLEGVPWDAIAAQLATWMRSLPGGVWDSRLPEAQS